MLVSVNIITFALKALPPSYFCVGGSGSEYFSKVKKKKNYPRVKFSVPSPLEHTCTPHYLSFFNDSLQVKLIRQFDI